MMVTTMSETELRAPKGEAEIRACFPVMRQLRPYLAGPEDFAARVARQAEAGYRLLAIWVDGRPTALAGWRVQENMIHGRFLYVDDLVTDAGTRSAGHGAALIAALRAEALKEGCGKLVLDTALDNAFAHRFYFRQGLLARALRFSTDVA